MEQKEVKLESWVSERENECERKRFHFVDDAMLQQQPVSCCCCGTSCVCGCDAEQKQHQWGEQVMLRKRVKAREVKLESCVWQAEKSRRRRENQMSPETWLFLPGTEPATTVKDHPLHDANNVVLGLPFESWHYLWKKSDASFAGEKVCFIILLIVTLPVQLWSGSCLICHQDLQRGQLLGEQRDPEATDRTFVLNLITWQYFWAIASEPVCSASERRHDVHDGSKDHWSNMHHWHYAMGGGQEQRQRPSSSSPSYEKV
jgi:hypothetical protein